MTSGSAQKPSIAELECSQRACEQVGSNEELALGPAIKRYPKVVAWTFAIITGVLFVGFDTVIVGTVTALPFFQLDFGRPEPSAEFGWILPAEWVSLWSAISPVGAILGSIFAGWFQDRAGRKTSPAAGSLTAITAIAIMYCSNLPDDVGARRGVFLVSKLLQGSSVGIILATTQTYVSEIAPPSLRGPAMALFPTFVLLGQLTGAAVIFGMSSELSPKSYLISFASQWPFAVLPLIMAIIMPQSPVWLLQRERIDEAHIAQKRLHKSDFDVAVSLEQMKAAIVLDRRQAVEISYLDCFKGIDRRRTLIVMLASTLAMLFGLPLLASASYFMQQVGMKASLSLVFLLIGIALGVVSNGVSVWIMSKVGRRILTLTTMITTTLLWMSIGISGVWHNSSAILYVAICMMMIIVTCGVGVWPASYAVAVETSSLRLRARSQGIGVLTSQLTNVVFQIFLPYIYQVDAGNLRGMTGFVLAGICGVGTVLCWFYIPDMRGRTAVEIDHMFEKRLSTRSFKRYSEASGVED